MSGSNDHTDRGRRLRARARFVASWAAAVVLLTVALPRAVQVSWSGVAPVIADLRWPAVVMLAVVWLIGLAVHTFVLTAAAPQLSHRRALTLNMTGSAVANVVPLGGAAGIELNRRMMADWGVDPRQFAGYTLVTNLWDVGSKLLLPVIVTLALLDQGATVDAALWWSAVVGAAGFAILGAAGFAVLASPRGPQRLGGLVEGLLARLTGRRIDAVGHLEAVRGDCARLVADGWGRMSLGITGYVVLQGVLFALCARLTVPAAPLSAVLAAFAVERVLTVVPVTPGGVGIADLGAAGVLIGLGVDPAGATAAAVLYRLFIFGVEIPVGGGALGLWLLHRRRQRRAPVVRLRPSQGRVVHVTDVFLPRLGGIETFVADLVAGQRQRGRDAEVLTATPGTGPDPAWVRRMPLREAREALEDYDAVHVHLSVISPYGIALARTAIARGLPTVITVHSMWTGAAAVMRLASRTGMRAWPVVWTAVSEPAARAVRQALPGVEVAVVPNAIDLEEWVGAEPRAEGSSARSRFEVISVMRLTRRKRPLAMLEAFARARRLSGADLHLTIVGEGGQRRRLARAVRRRGLNECVELTGRLPREQVRTRLGDATCYVAPAPRESFGIAALEARACGLPIVAFSRSGVSGFVADRIDGLLVADDAQLAVAIAELAVNDVLREAIAEHNRSIPPRFDWPHTLQAVDAAYAQAAPRTRAAVVPRLPCEQIEVAW